MDSTWVRNGVLLVVLQRPTPRGTIDLIERIHGEMQAWRCINGAPLLGVVTRWTTATLVEQVPFGTLTLLPSFGGDGGV